MNPTTRLSFRRFGPDDRRPLLTFTRDPEALKWMVHNLATEAAIDRFLAMALEPWGTFPGTSRHWAIDHAGALVGCLTLEVDPATATVAEVGYWLLPEYRGRGFGTEVVRAAVDYGFRLWGLHRIWGMCHVENLASARVMEKAGLVREGTLREHLWLRDHYRSSHLYGLLARDHFGVSEAEVTFAEFDRVVPEFEALIHRLDAELAAKNGDAQDQFTAFNALAGIEDVVIASAGGSPIACASFKRRSADTGEVKRVFLDPAWRGRGVARQLMQALETRACRKGLTTLLCETSRNFVHANRLYQALGYQVVPNFPPYDGIALSVCYRKELVP